MTRHPKFGDVYYVRLGRHVGMEQAAGRPAIIVSNNFGNEHSEIVEVVYLTTQAKVPLPTHVRIAAQKGIKESTALCEQICTVSKLRLSDKLAHLDSATMDEVRIGMMISLNIPENFPEGRDTDGHATTAEEACSEIQTAQAVQSTASSKEEGKDCRWTEGVRPT